MRVETRLNTYARRVDERLSALLPCESSAPSELHAAIRYSCLAPGKRLRPALCLSAAEAVGAPVMAASALDAGCAIEMVHCFSLIHDDLPAIDNDALRRGMPTCHVKFGEAMALLAGDALFSLAFEVMANVDAPSDRVLDSVRSLAKATGSEGLVGGEVMDVLAEGRLVSEEWLEAIHQRKTGALIAATCEIGGLLGGGSPDQVRHLRKFGEKIGLAFQIVDDMLNESSTAEQLGKAAGSDRERQKATYPGMHGMVGAARAAQALHDEAISYLDKSFFMSSGLRELAGFTVDRVF